MNEVVLPPAGTTADDEVFKMLSVFEAEVVTIPSVNDKTPFTSTIPPVPIERPEGLLISRL